MSKTHNPEVNLHIKLFKMIALANIYLNHFPRHEKYGLSQQIRNVMYDIYNLVTECQKRYHKKLLRKRSIYRFAAALKRRDYAALMSMLGHAKHACNYTNMVKRLEATYAL